jgi:hypothetical protein
MNIALRSIRAFAVLAAFIAVAALTTAAFATISDPAADRQMLAGSDVVAPLPGARTEAKSKSKAPLIRIAPHCTECIVDPG